MKPICLLLYLLLLVSQTEAASFSLFLTDEESQTAEQQAAPGNTLTVDAIMYLNDQSWTIWMNHEKITPEQCPGHIQINKVSQDCVDFEWLGASTPLPLNLKVNETIELPQAE